MLEEVPTLVCQRCSRKALRDAIRDGGESPMALIHRGHIPEPHLGSG